MNSQQAKFLLQGYRPGGGDADDALFREALNQVAHDPALAAWFERERSFDAKISEGLREVAPPAELRDFILAGGQATKTASSRHRRWRRAGLIKIAAEFLRIFWKSVSNGKKPGFDSARRSKKILRE